MNIDIDWKNWSKLKTVLLDDACGLVVGIDMEAYKCHLHYLEKCLKDDLMKDFAAEQRFEHQDYHRSLLIKKEGVLKIVNNHINSGSFIPTGSRPVSKEEYMNNNPWLTDVPKGDLGSYQTVKLTDFGGWAKLVGYPLPPEFPIERCNINWIHQAKMVLVSLGHAYSLLAGSDIPNYANRLYCLDKFNEKEKEDEFNECKINHSKFLEERDLIASVVQNHIKSNTFIPIAKDFISEDEFKRKHPRQKIPKGSRPYIQMVDLADFGGWAKSAGYDLPSAFPVNENFKTTFEIASLKNSNKKISKNISSRERVTVIKMIEVLEKFNNGGNNTKRYNDPLVYLNELILEYYGSMPTYKELQKDLQLGGLTTITTKTIGKYC